MTGMSRVVFDVTAGVEVPVSILIDLLAFTYLEDVSLKHSVLAEPEMYRRAEQVLEGLESLQPALQSNHFVGDPTLN